MARIWRLPSRRLATSCGTSFGTWAQIDERKASVGLKSDLESEVADVFSAKWEERDGNVVPEDDSVSLANDAVKLKATVLYADLADSTQLVDSQVAFVAAEVYKTFLHCAAKIIRSEDGEITAYDGD